MDYCIKCGAKLPKDAEFCTKCGNQVKSLDKEKKPLEEKIEKTAKGIGKKAEQVGKRIEKGAERAGNHFSQWYDKTFNIGGPLIGAFIGLIILRLIIYIIQTFDEDIFILTAFGEGLHEYLLFIFASFLITGYNTYLNKKYKKQYHWIYPLFSGIGFTLGAWILAKIFLIISKSNDTPIIQAIGNIINTYIIVIFILAIFIGYIYQVVFGPFIFKEK